ncbi:MAG: hypothetical protein ACK4K0_03010 [Flavobacteriales bacterium]
MLDEEGLIKITNYRDHPENNIYKVFFFYRPDMATYFEALLIEHKISYQKDTEENGDKSYTLFAVRKNDLKLAMRLNYLTMGKYRKPFIGNTAFKVILLFFTLLVVAIALVGYFKKG